MHSLKDARNPNQFLFAFLTLSLPPLLLTVADLIPHHEIESQPPAPLFFPLDDLPWVS